VTEKIQLRDAAYHSQCTERILLVWWWFTSYSDWLATTFFNITLQI